jgi:hypothetical protein
MKFEQPKMTLRSLLALVICLPALSFAQDHSAEKVADAFPANKNYSPYVGRNFPNRPLFGDTHLHTAFSMDAGAFGARLSPRDAYVFAKGNEVTASMGERARLSRLEDHVRGAVAIRRL